MFFPLYLLVKLPEAVSFKLEDKQYNFIVLYPMSIATLLRPMTESSLQRLFLSFLLTKYHTGPLH